MKYHNEKQIQNALEAIKRLGLIDFIKNFNSYDGFMWSSDHRIDRIGYELLSDLHSGASFAFTLRKCQAILNEEPEPEAEAPELNPPEPPNKDGVKVVGENIYNKMDDNNKKVTDIMASQGMEKAVEHMFKHPETGEPIDYATMRHFYG